MNLTKSLTAVNLGSRLMRVFFKKLSRRHGLILNELGTWIWSAEGLYANINLQAIHSCRFTRQNY